MAAAMIATIPPRGHFADASVALEPDGTYTLRVGTAEFGNGTTTVHTQLAAAVLGTEPDRVVVRQSDTDAVGYDTGAFGSAGSVVAGRAVHAAATALRERILGGGPREARSAGRAVRGAVRRALRARRARRATPATTARRARWRSTCTGSGWPSTPATGEVRILRSVQAADAGVVLNPEQCRGQVEGGVAQALGTALYEHLIVDGTGTVTTPGAAAATTSRRWPTSRARRCCSRRRRTTSGRTGRKSMSEAPYNPVAPALANAIRDAIGVRPHELPMTRDRIWRLAQHPVPTPVAIVLSSPPSFDILAPKCG